MAAPTLFLIDGSNQMYRAYHAIRGLTGPDGKSTNAVYGFVTMLRKLLADHQPAYIAASFDLRRPRRSGPGCPPTTRRIARRCRMTWRSRSPWVHEACEAMGVPIFTAEGFEADDVIGTLAPQGRRGRTTRWRSSPATRTSSSWSATASASTTRATKARGTTPTACRRNSAWRRRRSCDVLALMGDSIDNVKGVPGIGEKGARDLIATYGSLDSLLARAGEVTQKKYREGLLTHADEARQSRELVTIRTDVDVPFEPERFRFTGAARERCYALFSAAGLPDAGDRVRADGGVGREGLRSSCDSLEELRRSSPRSPGRRPVRRCGWCADGTAPVRATLVGLAVSTAARHGALHPARATDGFMGEGSLDRRSGARRC